MKIFDPLQSDGLSGLLFLAESRLPKKAEKGRLVRIRQYGGQTRHNHRGSLVGIAGFIESLFREDREWKKWLLP